MTGSCSGSRTTSGRLPGRANRRGRPHREGRRVRLLPGGHEVSIGQGFPRFSSPGSTSRPGRKIAAVAVPESVSGFSFSDDARTWATVDDAGKIEPPGGSAPTGCFSRPSFRRVSCPSTSSTTAGTSRSCPWIPSSARPASSGGGVGSTRGSDGSGRRRRAGPSPRIAIDEGGRRLVTGGRRLGRGLRHPGRLVDHDVRKAFVGGHRQLVQQRWQADRLEGDDGQAIVWDAASGQSVHILEGTRPRSSRRASVRTDERCTPPGSTARRSPGISPARDSSGGRSHSVPWHPRGACPSSSRTKAPRSPRRAPTVGASPCSRAEPRSPSMIWRRQRLCDARSRGAGGRACVEPTARRSRPEHTGTTVRARRMTVRLEGAPAEIPADVARPARRTARRRSPSAPTGSCLRRRSAMGTSACGTRSPARRSASRWEPRRISKVLPRTSPSLRRLHARRGLCQS